MGRGHSHVEPGTASERSLWWALGIALLAIQIGRRPADDRRSFGYRRLEILAAALNAAGLFLVAGYVLWEAIDRFLEPADVDSRAMLVVAFAGLVVNAIAMRLLYRGRSRSSSRARCGSTHWSRW